jgi:hypothetical protein
MWYSNSSLGRGGSLLAPVGNCVNYTTAAKLLGVNGTYGFRVTIMPTLNVSISKITWNPYLKLKVEVRGPGLVLSGANLNCFFYHAVLNPNAPSPFINVTSQTAQTDSIGAAYLDFPNATDPKYAYSIIVYARLSGLTGCGYLSNTTITNGAYIVPLMQNFEQGQVLLAHSWDINPLGGDEAPLHYNATFLVLSETLNLTPLQITNSSGTVNYGAYQQVQIPANAPTGILFVAYRKENEYGIAMMPWGVSALGFSTVFGGDPSGTDWVATDLRQVTVSKISYQVKVGVWSTKGYQSWGYHH